MEKSKDELHEKRNAAQKLLLILTLLDSGYQFKDADGIAMLESLKDSLATLEDEIKAISKS